MQYHGSNHALVFIFSIPFIGPRVTDDNGPVARKPSRLFHGSQKLLILALPDNVASSTIVVYLIQIASSFRFAMLVRVIARLNANNL